MKRKWPIVVLAGVGVIAVSIGVGLFAPIDQHWRAQSPDGAFTAIATTQPLYSFIAVMPGQGSDKPGRVTVYRGSQSCGSAWVPMVWMASDLRWEVDARPRRAEIRLIATWNLDGCTVERIDNR